jgi:hypothetical protein
MLKEQEEISAQLLRLHNVITGTNKTCEEIVRNRRIDPNISLSHYTELGGMMPSGARVSVEKYGTLGDKLDYGTAKHA